MVSAAPDLIIFFYGFCSTWRTIGMLVTHFLYIMASVSHLRATLTNPGKASCTQTHSIMYLISNMYMYMIVGYVQLTGLKIDFSSDLEHTEKPKKKRKKVFDIKQIDHLSLILRSLLLLINGPCALSAKSTDHLVPIIAGNSNYTFKHYFIIFAPFSLLESVGDASEEWTTIVHGIRIMKRIINSLYHF